VGMLRLLRRPEDGAAHVPVPGSDVSAAPTDQLWERHRAELPWGRPDVERGRRLSRRDVAEQVVTRPCPVGNDRTRRSDRFATVVLTRPGFTR